MGVDAVVLAGGMGTRLRPVVPNVPKPLAMAAGRPVLEWLLMALARQGMRRVVLATGYMGGAIRSYFADGSRVGIDIHYSEEQSPLGTGGALRLALSHITTPEVLVANGDSFCNCQVARLLETHRSARASATIWLVPIENTSPYGAVDVSQSGAITGFHEKATIGGPGLINAGVYLFDRSVIDAMPAGLPVSLEKDVFPSLVGRGLHSIQGGGPFLDIGTPASYARANDFFEAWVSSVIGEKR